MAIRAEEAFLHRTFGATYDLYRRDEAPPMLRRFSLDARRRNREYRAVAGLIGGFAILAAQASAVDIIASLRRVAAAY